MIDCIEWTGPFITTHGTTYGVTPGHDTQMAHRVSYECWFGGIPDDYVIDHLCRNGKCINPRHLEAVPNVVNIMRGMGDPAKNARKTHCKNGHEFTPENTRQRVGKRVCKTCSSEYNKKRWAERNIK